MFMGDCGSLMIGMIIGIYTLHYLSSKPLTPNLRLFIPDSRVIFVSAVLFIPLFDTTRIIIIRILNGKSPFEADRNHLHHVLLDRGLSHLKASISLGFLNIFVLCIFFLISKEFSQIIVLIIMLLLYALITLMFYMLKRNPISKKVINA